MSERERWIVYPLLFFALGAAIRDKILNVVESKQVACGELEAKTIRCQELVVTDPAGRGAGLAKLGSTLDQQGGRRGVLVLTDSGGNEFCGLVEDELLIRRLRCENLAIIDSHPPARAVAGLSVQEFSTTENPNQRQRAGVLLLNSQITPLIPGVPPVTLRQPGAIPSVAPPAETPGVPAPQQPTADDADSP
ncbi:MAG: hypothetical protein CMJ58_08485 [Planctomycetaceae bacterium]|nr:hypothetical protein [Planctomycetaceae bacterium]